jgi:N-carbamoyl-L-amino-acid hydrolase
MDPGLRGHIAAAAERRVPGEWIEMPSAAGHDPMVLSHHLPCAMLFIPSIGGVSHDFSEDSTDHDIVTGCQVLADAAVSILTAPTAAPSRRSPG